MKIFSVMILTWCWAVHDRRMECERVHDEIDEMNESDDEQKIVYE